MKMARDWFSSMK